MSNQVPSSGWGAQPTGPMQAQPAGFGTAPPAGFGSQPQPQPQPQQPPQQNVSGPGGYPTTAPPMQIIQPTAQAAQQPTTPPPAQRQLFPTDQPVPQQPVQQQPEQVPANPSIQTMIRQFAKQPGCERYSGDAEKVRLLEEYLWCRQIVPGLSIDVFLGLYAAVADFNSENAKHPADAIKNLLPRQKKQADTQATHHWSSKEVVDFVALYVDMIREAEQKSTPIPMTFNEFLVSPALLEGFHAGHFKEEPAPKAPKTPGAPRTAAAPRSTEKVRPTAVGQRVIYTNGNGRQFRGLLTNYWQDAQSTHTFCDFQADAGEEFKGIGLISFEMCSDAPPNAPQDNEGHELPELARGKLTIIKAQFPSVVTALAMDLPLGTVAIGDTVYSFNHQFPTGHVAVLDVVNGETGPYVDARLCLNTPDNVLFEVNPPRKNIEGLYTFEIAEGSFSLEVVGNK